MELNKKINDFIEEVKKTQIRAYYVISGMFFISFVTFVMTLLIDRTLEYKIIYAISLLLISLTFAYWGNKQI
jgi:cation transport ATPase